MNRFTAVLALLTLAASSLATAQSRNPCTLLSKAEIESVVGGPISGLDGSNNLGGTQTCSGVVAKRMSVMLMYVTSNQKVADPMGYLEAESRKAANSIGAQMDVKKFGPILCTTLIPPKQGPYSTQCMVIKPPSSMASIAVMVAKQQEMVSIDKLHILAEKMLRRF